MMGMRVRVKYKIPNSTIGTEESIHTPVIKASPDPRSIGIKNIGNQAYRPKELLSKWNWRFPLLPVAEMVPMERGYGERITRAL